MLQIFHSSNCSNFEKHTHSSKQPPSKLRCKFLQPLFLKVLKAIGLQRTGKQDEAFSLAQEVSTLEPTDDNSLQALTILYREMHRREYTDVHKQ